MHAAVVVVDMLKDVLAGEHSFPITPHALAIVERINELTRWARAHAFPVVFACDSFLPDDFIFRSRMRPHCLQGSPGAEPIGELDRTADDLVLPKRRFSAFFGTDFAELLRSRNVDTIVVCGISTHVCVLTTALDALCHDLCAVIVEDGTASYSPEMHRQTLELYRRSPLRPLLRVLTAEQVMAEVG